ncbi:SDR family NAD(P)-dependent oxidoreductase [Aeromicrobium sp. CF4.19]|uniref:SDR family NAD(P)-dependent oxidoreductase n=1 Tax=Aeromicrobium sp. CF4.19 TaxID=3373082 RepID=UPI003EE7B2DD
MTSPALDVLDTVLDKAVLPGYSAVGIRLRQRWWPADPPEDALVGRRVVVTGASGGLGEAAALELVRLGATVHLVGRTAERLRDAAGRLRAAVPGAAVQEDVCDVSDLAAVRAYAERLRGAHETLDGLVHGAGVMPAERTESAQGHEATLATHVLGPLLLTRELAPLLERSDDARVVVVSSGGMYTAPLDAKIADDLQYRQGSYDGVRAYARTKRLQVVLAEELAAELTSAGVAVHSMHPGWADTPGITDSLPRFARLIGPVLRTPAEGADTIVWLVAAPGPGRRTGLFWCDRRPRPTAYLPGRGEDRDARRRAWAACDAAVRTGS